MKEKWQRAPSSLPTRFTPTGTLRVLDTASVSDLGSLDLSLYVLVVLRSECVECRLLIPPRKDQKGRVIVERSPPDSYIKSGLAFTR